MTASEIRRLIYSPTLPVPQDMSMNDSAARREEMLSRARERDRRVERGAARGWNDSTRAQPQALRDYCAQGRRVGDSLSASQD